LSEPLPPRWNIAPTDPALAVAAGRDEGRRRMGQLRWGLVPHWAADPKIGGRLINARAETVTTKPAYRDAFATRRVLIPADGWYEWQVRAGIRQPYFLHAASGEPLAFGGVWDSWTDRTTGERLRTCAIVTTAANRTTRKLHDRMPLVLSPDTWDVWLTRQPLTVDERADLLRPASETSVAFHAVSRQVNSVANDGPDLVTPVDSVHVNE
jgi:putative SOS response-associated peptidase YedK